MIDVLQRTGARACSAVRRDFELAADRFEVLEPRLQQVDELMGPAALGGHPEPEQHLGVVVHPGEGILAGVPQRDDRVVRHVEHLGQVGLAKSEVLPNEADLRPGQPRRLGEQQSEDGVLKRLQVHVGHLLAADFDHGHIRQQDGEAEFFEDDVRHCLVVTKTRSWSFSPSRTTATTSIQASNETTTRSASPSTDAPSKQSLHA